MTDDVPSKRLQPTGLIFQDALTPVSPLFGDVYFYAQNGIEESRYVYLEGSGFTAELQSANARAHLTIGEIGFGVGLNFLLTLQEFSKSAAPSQRLTYISAEKHPVFLKDLQLLYSRFPELKKEAELLFESYPVLTPGFHSISFLDGRVTLLLLLGDAVAMFKNLEAEIDFWYWDGFSPSKNADAFSAPLFLEVARLSAPQARGASFTAAGWVRRELEKVGFKIEKRVGFGAKRECIAAQLKHDSPPIYAQNKSKKKINLAPWFSSENLSLVKPGESVAVIGAGLAGSAIARELKIRGVPVVDAHGIAKRASGNSAGLFSVQLSRRPNPISRFSQAALTHFLREAQFGKFEKKYGVLLGREKPEALESSEYPDDFYEVRPDGIYFPQSGFLHPQQLCENRLQNISVIQAEVFSVNQKDDEPFRLKNKEGVTLCTADHVVYALGADFVQQEDPLRQSLLNTLPLRAIRGQTIEVEPTTESRGLRETILDQGYITPVAPEITGNENHMIGATYQAKDIFTDQAARDTAQLLADVKSKWPELGDLQKVVSQRVGYRLSTPDKLPLIGPLCSPDWIREKYGHVLRGGRPRDLPALEVQPREWMLLALGSRGITFSAYGAKILASLMCGEALPIEIDLWEHLHSARFAVRETRKSKA
jgi:tRNA 5-methylaminomethyl-2-thiouridine biosynthesis bifunctional protein